MTVKVRKYRKSAHHEVDIVVRLPDGSERRERRKAPVTSKSGALRWGQERERHLLLHWEEERKRAEEKQRRKGVPTLQEFAPRYIERYAKANRQKPSGIVSKVGILRHHLLPLLGDRKLDEIREEDVQELKAKLSEHAPKTVNNVLSVLKKVLTVAVEWNVIPQVPVRAKLLKVTSPTMAFYDFDDYGRLLEGAAKVDPRVLALVQLGGDAGLRAGEIIALEWTDLDFRRGVLLVERSEWKGAVTTPKSGKARRVSMTAALQATLQSLRHLKGPRVLYRDDGSSLTQKTMQVWMQAAQRRAGMKADGRIHVLRHTFCSHLAMLGVPARTIQELAGHADLGTTQRYMHLSPAALESGIRALEGRPTASPATMPAV